MVGPEAAAVGPAAMALGPAAMDIMVVAAHVADKVAGAGTDGIEECRADMVMATEGRAVAATMVLEPAVSRIVDLVVGGKADPMAGSANGVLAAGEASDEVV